MTKRSKPSVRSTAQRSAKLAAGGMYAASGCVGYFERSPKMCAWQSQDFAGGSGEGGRAGRSHSGHFFAAVVRSTEEFIEDNIPFRHLVFGLFRREEMR